MVQEGEEGRHRSTSEEFSHRQGIGRSLGRASTSFVPSRRWEGTRWRKAAKKIAIEFSQSEYEVCLQLETSSRFTLRGNFYSLGALKYWEQENLDVERNFF